MDSKRRLTRRQFLFGMLAALGGAMLAGLRRFIGLAAPGEPADMVPRVYLPLIARNYPPPESSRVVHVHDPDATSWSFSSSSYYWQHVSQSAVDRMVEEGLKTLTGTASVQEAWLQLLPNYQPGQVIAIKVNFNNAPNCSDADNVIDALIEPVNSLIATLKAFGVPERDIWIFDALRALPDRFVGRLLYGDVRLFDSRSKGCREDATFVSDDPHAEVSFQHPNLTNRRLTDVVINADYLINMPIMKDHGISGVTLGFKNHFGTIDRVVGGSPDDLHIYINPSDYRYSPDYNPMLDIYLNPHIRDKTVLTVGDGLYGALGNTNVEPSRWSTFGNDAPNSLFFSRDPVAIDCVMLDILDAEPTSHPQRSGGHADDYLELAEEAGLGTFERGDPWQTPYGSGYSRIEYLRIEL